MISGAQKGGLLVVSSPSGAGKTTLSRRLLAEFSGLQFSVSYTTRPMRANEVDGVDYHFVDDAVFDEMIAAEAFAEWARVHGNRYGTSKRTIDENTARGSDVLFDIDWQGAQSLKTEYQQRATMVFVLPPSLDELARRLRARGTEADEIVARRLAKAKEELGHYAEYDYLVTNDDLERAYAELRAIYVASRCSRFRRSRDAKVLLDEVRTE